MGFRFYFPHSCTSPQSSFDFRDAHIYQHISCKAAFPLYFMEFALPVSPAFKDEGFFGGLGVLLVSSLAPLAGFKLLALFHMTFAKSKNHVWICLP